MALVAGAVQGMLVLLLARLFGHHRHRALAALLLLAALFYVHFALRAGASGAWLALEIVGVLIFGAFALVGIRRLPWLALGWLLHPLWDIALHYVGPGHAFAPESHTVPCLTWDVVVAAGIALDAVRAHPSITTAAAPLPAAAATAQMPASAR